VNCQLIGRAIHDCQLPGHSSADMTMRYLKITLPDVQREFHRAETRWRSRVKLWKDVGMAAHSKSGKYLMPDCKALTRFHNKMETISRQAYGFRNFENYRLRV
jgi:hypothetical protein